MGLPFNAQKQPTTQKYLPATGAAPAWESTGPTGSNPTKSGGEKSSRNRILCSYIYIYMVIVDLPSFRTWYAQRLVPFLGCWDCSKTRRISKTFTSRFGSTSVLFLRFCQKMQNNGHVGAVGRKVKKQVKRKTLEPMGPKKKKQKLKKVKNVSPWSKAFCFRTMGWFVLLV